MTPWLRHLAHALTTTAAVTRTKVAPPQGYVQICSSLDDWTHIGVSVILFNRKY